MLEVQPDLVTVLADTIERSEDLDKDRAEAAKKQAEALAHKGDLSPEARARAIEQLTEAKRCPPAHRSKNSRNGTDPTQDPPCSKFSPTW